jgi:N-acyl-D-amino-acid deacylase
LLEIGRVTRMPVHISHMKLGMRSLWGQGDRLLATLDRARSAGIQVSADVYPYTMWQSSLTTLYPKRNFTDRAETEFILKEVARPEDLLIASFSPNPSYAGKTVREIAALNNTDPASALLTLMASIVEKQVRWPDEGVVATGMDQSDIDRLYRWPHTNVCSDGAHEIAHPRGFGSFPRVLGNYVRDRHVLALEEAVRRMTSLAAASMGFTDRGVVRPGMAADLVLFDAATVADRATVKEPRASSEGVKTVWVNGVMVYDNGKTTMRFPGQIVRRAPLSSSARTTRESI